MHRAGGKKNHLVGAASIGGGISSPIAFAVLRLMARYFLGWAGPDGVRVSDQCVRASRQIMLELLAEVPIAASLGGIRPIPAQVDRRRRRHSRSGHDGAQCDTV